QACAERLAFPNWQFIDQRCDPAIRYVMTADGALDAEVVVIPEGLTQLPSLRFGTVVDGLGPLEAREEVQAGGKTLGKFRHQRVVAGTGAGSIGGDVDIDELRVGPQQAVERDR